MWVAKKLKWFYHTSGVPHRNERRIKYLEKKYSETNVAKGELLSPSTIKRINKNYNQNQKRRRVDAILNNVKNKDTIKDEVHNIVDNTSLKSLCYNCSEEQIIAVVILYVSKTRVKGYRIDRTKLWNEYNLNWQRYGLIISNLLKDVRENTIQK